mmetsp:Transcript_98208/g.305766  ORF Transcript_98208/g.305766 Transcript_98208/m.305766 type:complete len:213 (+) Transcript_98208:27-665(+)
MREARALHASVVLSPPAAGSEPLEQALPPRELHAGIAVHARHHSPRGLLARSGRELLRAVDLLQHLPRAGVAGLQLQQDLQCLPRLGEEAAHELAGGLPVERLDAPRVYIQRSAAVLHGLVELTVLQGALGQVEVHGEQRGADLCELGLVVLEEASLQNVLHSASRHAPGLDGGVVPLLLVRRVASLFLLQTLAEALLRGHRLRRLARRPLA